YMQGIGMVRYPAFRGYPIRARKVRLIDNESIPVPSTHCVSSIGRRHAVAMRPSVEGDDLKSVIRLRQHHDELRRLDDLSDGTHVEEAHIQSAESRWSAMQRWVVFIAQRLGVRYRRRLIQAGKGGWRLRRRRSSALRPSSSCWRGC